MNYLIPIAGILTLGGILGYSAATFLKTVSKVTGCLIGVVFVLMQLLAYTGVVEWHWEVLQQYFGPAGEAVQSGASTLWKILTYNLPFTGGFGAGFWYGWRH
ncbi:MAG: FUN14 domain-containing protein [Armatimonadota bacterium]